MDHDALSYLYITEPDTIDEKRVNDILQDSTYSAVAGSKDFSKAQVHPYEVLLIRSQTLVDNTIKEHFPFLKSIVRVGTGLDNVDVDFCKANDISVFNAAGANADAVSEYVVATTLYVLRKLHLLTPEDALSWNRFKFRGQSVSEQTIGIVGFGNIGKLVYQKLHAFRPQGFFAYDPFITQDMVTDFEVTMTSLEDLLSRCSVVTLHLPLIPATEYLLNGKNIPTLRAGCIIINASRGGIVNEQAILDYAPKHNITYIADTVEGEPHPSPTLIASESTVITPHIASLTKASEESMLTVAIENFLNDLHLKL